MKKIFDFYANVNKKDKLAFNDALPIGNGSMGAMVYGSPIEEKLILNEDSLWLGKKNRQRENKDFIKYYPRIKELIKNDKIKEAEELLKLASFSSPKGQCIYSVAGEMHIIFNHTDYTNYKRCLDLDNGLVLVDYDFKKNHIKRTSFASYPDKLIVNNIKSLNPINFYGFIDREKLVDEIYKLSDNEIELTYKYNEEDTLYIRLKVITDGILDIIGDNFVVKNSTNTTLYLCLRTTYYADALSFINKYLNKVNYDTIYHNHLDDYHKLYNRQIFDSSNNTINYMYNLSRYLMISSSRINTQPANLQGIWNQDIFPSWDSKYTININLQMNYFNVFRSNLVECSLPYFDLLKRMHKSGTRLAKTMYNTSGFVAFHNSDIYGDCAPQDKYLPATYWPLGGCWLSLLIYDYYSYTLDIKFLKDNYYIIYDAALFMRNILDKNEDNEYVLIPSLSPENSYILNGDILHISKGSMMDSEILYDLFNSIIKINSILNINLSDNIIYQDIINHLPKISLTTDGRIKEWPKEYVEAEPGHRHISQLYALYPSNQINMDNITLYNAAKKTILTRLENGGGHTGWSKAWITAMFARLNEGDLAFKSFNEFIEKSTSRVGLDLHPPFQIDGNFGIASAISEMLVRENGDKLYLLPALPSDGINCGKYYGILLRNNIILDIKWKNNKIYYVKLINDNDFNININIVCNKISINIPNSISLMPHSKIIFK